TLLGLLLVACAQFTAHGALNFVYEWTRVQSSSNEAAVPPARQEFFLAHVPSQAMLVLFGGRDRAGVRDDTWFLDLTTATWSLLNNTATRPPPRFSMVGGVHEQGRVYITSGQSSGGVLTSDTYMLDVSSDEARRRGWSLVETAGD